MAVLAVLGTTVLSMTLMNVNMKYTDERMKKSLYYSESGIDQVYSKVSRYVDEALVEASDKTKEQIAIKNNKMQDILEQLNTDANIILTNEGNKADIYALYNLMYGESGLDLESFYENKLYLKALLGYAKVSTLDPSADPSTALGKLYAFYRDNYGYAGVIPNPYYEFYNYYVQPMQQTLSGSMEPAKLDTDKQASEPVFRQNDRNIMDYSIDKEAVQEDTNQYFNSFFKGYFAGKENQIRQALVISEDNEQERYVFLDGASSEDSDITINIPEGGIDAFTAADPEHLIIHDIESTFTYKGKNRMTIKTDLVIEAPDDETGISVDQRRYETKSNPLWQYAIVTQDDFIIGDNNNSSIKGNVYILGNNPPNDYSLPESNSNSPRNSLNYRGLIMDGNNSSLEVDGDVVTQSYIQIGENSRNSKMTFTNSHVYTNSFVVQKGSENGTLEIDNGNLYTSDDIELNGTNSQIRIDGSYYGYMGTAKEYNQTSSIVINSDIGIDNSFLSITGNAADIDYPEKYSGILIAGAAYVNEPFDPNPYNSSNPDLNLYQTGESMGIKGNYIAYAFPPNEDMRLKTNPSSKVSSAVTEGQKSKVQLYYKFENKDLMTVEDKASFFQAVGSQEGSDAFMNFGYKVDEEDNKTPQIKIPEDKLLYSLGVVIGQKGGETGAIDSKSGAGNTIYEELKAKIPMDYVYQMYYLQHRNGQTSFYGYDGELTKGATPEDAAITQLNQAEVIKYFSKIDSQYYGFNMETDLSEAEDATGTKNVREVAITMSPVEENKETDPPFNTDNILLVGANSAYRSASNGEMRTIGGVRYRVVKSLDTTPTQMQGIVLTGGRVRLSGQMTFKGAIIAQEQINFEDGANINLINENNRVQQYLTKLVMTRDNLKGAFDVDTEGAPLNKHLDNISFLENIVVGPGEIDSLRKFYNQFIYYDKWSIEE